MALYLLNNVSSLIIVNALKGYGTATDAKKLLQLNITPKILTLDIMSQALPTPADRKTATETIVHCEESAEDVVLNPNYYWQQPDNIYNSVPLCI